MTCAPRIPTANPESPTTITHRKLLTQSMPAIEAVFTAVVEARICGDGVVVDADDPFYDEVADVWELARALLETVRCTEAVYLQTLIFIDRARARGVIMHERNGHGLLVTAFVLAAKWLIDEWPGDWSVARLAGVSKWRLRRMERHFLDIVDHRLMTRREQFEACARNHMREATMSPTSGRAVSHILRVEGITGIW